MEAFALFDEKSSGSIEARPARARASRPASRFARAARQLALPRSFALRRPPPPRAPRCPGRVIAGGQDRHGAALAGLHTHGDGRGGHGVQGRRGRELRAAAGAHPHGKLAPATPNHARGGTSPCQRPLPQPQPRRRRRTPPLRGRGVCARARARGLAGNYLACTRRHSVRVRAGAEDSNTAPGTTRHGFSGVDVAVPHARVVSHRESKLELLSPRRSEPRTHWRWHDPARRRATRGSRSRHASATRTRWPGTAARFIRVAV